MRQLLAIPCILLLVGAAVPLSATARPAEGFVEADTPLALDGDLYGDATNPTLWIQNPDLNHPGAPIVLTSDRAEITRHVHEVQSVSSPASDHSADLPPSDTRTETLTVEDARIEISALGKTADVLVGPRDGSTLHVDAGGDSVQARVDVSPDGLLVQDGYREMHNIEDGGDNDDPASGAGDGSGRAFNYEYAIDAPTVSLSGAPTVRLAGAAHGYVWDAHVVVRNQTRTIESFETGARFESSSMGTTHEEHYEYLTLSLDGVEATLHPAELDTRLIAKALGLDLIGDVTLPDPSGSLASEDGLYRTDGEREVAMEGNLSLALTPGPSTDDRPRVTVGVTGDLSSIDAPLVGEETLISTENVVAASAGGATLVGLAAWYLVSVKGAGLALPLVSRPREQDEEEHLHVEDAGDLLFDPDRFTLYHLIRSRAGLSAEECRSFTGIERAEEQLDLLVEHDLLSLLSDSPRRYVMPGAFDNEQGKRIAFLREPTPLRVAELLAVHGLIPEEQLAERVRRTDGASAARRVPKLVRRFVDLGLAYRERGREGFVVDPTDELFSCLERMGTGAVPKSS